MPKTEEEYREDVVMIGRLVYDKGWIAANDGNISLRLEDGCILCTPTNISKGMMQTGDLIICDTHGQKVRGNREPTSELEMHLAIYHQRPDIRAVLHAHPPVATGFAVAGRPLNMAILPEVIVALGSVPLAEYGLPGTAALAEALRPYIPNYDALLMANHGCVTYGQDIHQAFFRMETVEHYARVTFVAEMLGSPNVLPREEVRKLFEARRRYGVQSAATMRPGHPIVAEDLLSQ